MRPFVLPQRAEFGLLAVIVFGVGFYVVGLCTGAVTAIGYERATKAQSGVSSTNYWETSVGVPVWLGARQAIRADFEVEARFGAVTLTVAPPLGF